MKGQELPVRMLLIAFVVVIIAIIILIAFAQKGSFQFASAWADNVFKPAGIK